MTLSQQSAFLRLAGVYLACRWCAMGNTIPGCLEARGGLEWNMLGMRDYQAEMRLTVESCNPSPEGL